MRHGIEEFQLRLQLAKQVAQDHPPAKVRDFLDGPAAAFQKNFPAKVFEGDNLRAEVSTHPLAAGELALGLERRLAGNDPKDAAAQRRSPQGRDDLLHAPAALTRPGPAKDKSHAHIRFLTPNL
jgi:hypothetical protein